MAAFYPAKEIRFKRCGSGMSLRLPDKAPPPTV